MCYRTMVLIVAVGTVFVAYRQPKPYSESAASTGVSYADSTSVRNAFRQADAIPSVRSLFVQKNDSLLIQKYFDGQQPGRPMNMKSASKSIISLLVGIAIDRGLIESKDQPIYHYFPEYFERLPASDSLKRTITIEDLLTMRSGLETTSFHNYGRWVTSDDWVTFVLEQPMVEKPGGEMVYSTGTSHLLSVIVEKASGMTTRAFAEAYLFRPLHIEPGGWQQDPDGYYFGGNNLALKPSDMVKIGQMALNGGTYEGTRIVSKEWIRSSFKTYTRSNYNPYDYGYMWWNRRVGDYKVFFAWGYGGQYIFMLPELDAVVVITSSLAGATQSRRYKEPVFELLQSELIPVLEDRAQAKE